MDMKGAFPESEDLGAVTRRAGHRLRLERLKGALFKVFLGLALVEGAWAGCLLFRREWIAGFPCAAMIVGAALVVVTAWECFRPTDPKWIHRQIDRRLGLPDTVLSTAELSGEDSWLGRLRADTLARVGSVNWSQVWPAPWPKGSSHSVFSSIALFALLGFLYQADLDFRRVLANRPAQRDPRAAALEALFQDWDKAKEKDESLKKLMESIAPVRQQLSASKGDERQQLASLNRLEEIVAAEKAKLAGQSIEAQAAKLANAFQSMEGMGALAAALRKNDFDKAAECAKQQAEALAAEKAQVPNGAKEAGQAAQQLSQQLGKEGAQGQLSQALSQFSQGAKEGDRKKMSSGLGSLQQSLGKQGARESESKRLSTQLSQLGFCKNPGEGKSSGMNLMPRLSMMKQKQPGKGAGSETDLNRFGAETQLASERHEELMKNTAGEGESETTTVKSAQGQSEALRTARATSFQEYQKLSQQAIADEAIPAAHREAIKRYFEKIRPDSDSK
jgi:hypothetical protein